MLNRRPHRARHHPLRQPLKNPVCTIGVCKVHGVQLPRVQGVVNERVDPQRPDRVARQLKHRELVADRAQAGPEHLHGRLVHHAFVHVEVLQSRESSIDERLGKHIGALPAHGVALHVQLLERSKDVVRAPKNVAADAVSEPQLARHVLQVVALRGELCWVRVGPRRGRVQVEVGQQVLVGQPRTHGLRRELVHAHVLQAELGQVVVPTPVGPILQAHEGPPRRVFVERGDDGAIFPRPC